MTTCWNQLSKYGNFRMKKNSSKFDDLVHCFHKNHVYESNWIFWVAMWQKFTPKKTLVWTWKESLAVDTYSLFSYYLCTSCTLTALSGLTYLVVHICWTFVCSNLQTQKMQLNTQLQQQQTPFLLHHPQIKLYAQSQLLAYFISMRKEVAHGHNGSAPSLWQVQTSNQQYRNTRAASTHVYQLIN